MAFVVAKHGGGMPLVDDQDAVEEFAADGADEGSAIALARGARTGVLMILTLMAVKTVSKAAVNLASRSRMRNRKRRPASSRSMQRLRACRVSQA
jgi:carbamate kinase